MAEPPILVFLLFTIGLMGGAAVLTGHALAAIWRPAWQVVLYGLLLTTFDRFLVWGLFRGPPWSLSGFLIDGAVIVGAALLAYRITLVGRMVSQYPWLYVRRGLFSYRDITASD